jgi:hypothetical protein
MWRSVKIRKIAHNQRFLVSYLSISPLFSCISQKKPSTTYKVYHIPDSFSTSFHFTALALLLTDNLLSAKLEAVKLNVGSLQQQAEKELMLF